MRKTLSLYATVTERHELRIYDDTIRKLFKLPARLGKVTAVELIGNGVKIVFERTSGKRKDRKFI